MKTPDQLSRDASSAANNPYRSQGVTGGGNSSERGTPPGPSMPVPQRPKAPATWDPGSGSKGAYGNDY